MRRRALLVGINDYDHMDSLEWCTDDALAMREVVHYHANHDPNYECRLLLGSRDHPDERVTFTRLREALDNLFAFDDEVLFYFSGHGYPTERGTYVMTQDGTPTVPGILLDDVVRQANVSSAREVLLIVDACFAGGAADAGHGEGLDELALRPGVTLLAAARRNERAVEVDGQGMFTRLVVGALKGGAADVRGHVSAASIYAYAEQALGPWDQRPVYKSNASRLSPIRYCAPAVTDEDLRRLPQLFVKPNQQYFMDATYEVTCEGALPEHVAIFRLFKRYQVTRLLRPSFAFDEDLFFVALRKHSVELTALGQFYWSLARRDLIGGTPAFGAQRGVNMRMPDAESVAQLFHETYERLAPAFGYETRDGTRLPWEQVPERNRRLMIAATAEVLALLFAREEASAPAHKEAPAPPPENE